MLKNLVRLDYSVHRLFLPTLLTYQLVKINKTKFLSTFSKKLTFYLIPVDM